MVNAAAFLPYGHTLHRDYRADGPPAFQLEDRLDRRARIRLFSNEYPLCAELLSPAAMPVHGDAYLLAVLRGDQRSPIAPQIPHRRLGDLLRGLSFVGGKRIYCSRFVPCPARCAVGRMVVAKRIPSLPMRLVRGHVSGRTVLLAHT